MIRFWNSQVLEEMDAVRGSDIYGCSAAITPILTFPHQGGRDFSGTSAHHPTSVSLSRERISGERKCQTSSPT